MQTALREPGFPVRKHIRDFGWLVRGELYVLREQWFWYLVQASFAPLSYLFFLAILIGTDTSNIAYLVTGSLVTSFSFAGMLTLGQRLGGLKEAHAFEYFAALPVSKSVFTVSLATQGVLLTLPSSLIIAIMGRVLFDFTLPVSATVVLGLSAYSMCGFGAVIGFWSPTGQVASLATQVLQTITIFFAPVFFPSDALPKWLHVTSFIWPSTYAAQALREIADGQSLWQVWQPLAILSVFVVMSLLVVPMRLDWRTSAR